MKLRSNGRGLLGISGSAECDTGVVERERKYLTRAMPPRKVTIIRAPTTAHEARELLSCDLFLFIWFSKRDYMWIGLRHQAEATA